MYQRAVGTAGATRESELGPAAAKDLPHPTISFRNRKYGKIVNAGSQLSSFPTPAAGKEKCGTDSRLFYFLDIEGSPLAVGFTARPKAWQRLLKAGNILLSAIYFCSRKCCTGSKRCGEKERRRARLNAQQANKTRPSECMHVLTRIANLASKGTALVEMSARLHFFGSRYYGECKEEREIISRTIFNCRVSWERDSNIAQTHRTWATASETMEGEKAELPT